MRINGELSVFLGALLIWLTGFQWACEAIIAASDGRWMVLAFKGLAAFGAVGIGLRVWRAA